LAPKERQQQACALQVEFFNFVALRLLHTPLSFFFSTGVAKKKSCAALGAKASSNISKRTNKGALARSRTHTRITIMVQPLVAF
jgi:hypothetical protein